MDRRRFTKRLLQLSAGLALGPLCSCARSRPLILGIHPWIGYETLYLAREFGWLPGAVRFSEGRTAGDSLMSLTSGRVDVACLTLDETLRARGSGIPLTVALVFDVSIGADVLLARPSIATLADLGGKRLGFERGAVGALVLEKLLAATGLPRSALILIDIPIDQHLAAWREGTVDALITYQPTADWVLREGARRLYDSRQLPETIFDVLAVHRKRSVGIDESLRALIACHFLALEQVRIRRQDAIYRIADHQGLAFEEAAHALRGVAQPSLAANWQYLSRGKSRLIAAAEALSALMVREGLLARPDALEGLVSPAWLPTPR